MGKTLKRRRKEAKTNYLKRLNMLKGKVPRIIFRKSNKYILAQLIISKNAQDKVELSLSSKALLNYGWPKEASNSLKTLPAAYLTGLLIGKKIKEKTKEKKFVIDIEENKELTRAERLAKKISDQEKEKLASWKPKTQLGRKVKPGEIKNIDYILDNNLKILEEQIVDSLISVKSDLILIGQSKGK